MVGQDSGLMHGSNRQNVSVTSMIERRTLGSGFGISEKCKLRNSLLPNKPYIVHEYSTKVFCGLYSKDGSFYTTATQDKRIHVYCARDDRFRMFMDIRAHDVGWSILDMAFSPDRRYIAYSSWSESLYQCSLNEGKPVVIEKLPLKPTCRRFCVFSIEFSYDGREILSGANDKYLYMYDRECHQQVMRFKGHEKDVNTIAFADDSSQVFYSGSDDGLCKIWDRRTIEGSNPYPVGVLAGHSNGITYIDSRGDQRYLISNSKDQSIKLWDIRKCSNRRTEQIARDIVNRQDWDYRWQPMPATIRQQQFLDGDSSIMTYYGHCIRKTLIRCRFSPKFATGQRYIYTGDSRGRLIIYDLLTGEIVLNVKGHKGCVRDVSWHPYNHIILTSSWDGKVGKWSYRDDESCRNDQHANQE